MKYAENTEQKELLDNFLANASKQLPNEILNKLYEFSDIVVNTKEYGNLISLKDSEKFLSRRITDSLIPYIFIDKILNFNKELLNSYSKIVAILANKQWADMGSGAGSPVFPLAIVFPQTKFYAVEPRNMRAHFLQFAKEQLNLENLTIISKRFETSGLAYLDFVSCRALSTFENDWERAQPGLKNGGIFITLKSFNNIVYLENSTEVNVYKYTLPQEEQTYALVTRGNK